MSVKPFEEPAVRMPRGRFTVRRMMVVIAVLAVGVAVMMRPYPIGGFPLFGLGNVWWSDGSMAKGTIPIPTNYVGYGPILKVKWSDGAASWYLGRSVGTDAGFLQEQSGICVHTLRRDRSESRRAVAASWLAYNADSVVPGLVVPALAAAVNNPSLEVRGSVVVALQGFIGRSPSAVSLLVVALKDTESVVRVAAAYALGNARPDTDQTREVVIPALFRALSDPSVAVRRRAAKSLVSLRGNDNADSAIAEALRCEF